MPSSEGKVILKEPLFIIVGGRGGEGKFSKIRLLSNERARRVEAELKQIEEDKSIKINGDLKKAAYLRFISDNNPQEIDLYWLCNELLLQVSQKGLHSEDDIALFQELRASYQKHVENL